MKKVNIEINDNKYDGYMFEKYIYFSTLKHPVNMIDENTNQTHILPPSGLYVRGLLKDKQISENETFILTNPVYIKNYKEYDILKMLKEKYPNMVFLGSYISALSYPSLIYSFIPVEGLGTGVLSDKLMNARHFRIFSDKLD